MNGHYHFTLDTRLSVTVAKVSRVSEPYTRTVHPGSVSSKGPFIHTSPGKIRFLKCNRLSGRKPFVSAPETLDGFCARPWRVNTVNESDRLFGPHIKYIYILNRCFKKNIYSIDFSLITKGFRLAHTVALTNHLLTVVVNV